MENATCIFYPERTIAHGNRSDGRVAHETAHQWFGDAVSDTDWSDVWLSEGLATYCEWDYDEAHLDPATMSSQLTVARDRVVDYVHEHPHSTIVDTAYDTPEEMLNRNTYEKAGFVLRLLRSCVGGAAFQQGLRNYLTRHLHGAAGTSEFRVCMERAAGIRLDWFFRQWFYAPGYPVVNCTWRYDADRSELVIRTTQSNPYGEPRH